MKFSFWCSTILTQTALFLGGLLSCKHWSSVQLLGFWHGLICYRVTVVNAPSNCPWVPRASKTYSTYFSFWARGDICVSTLFNFFLALLRWQGCGVPLSSAWAACGRTSRKGCWWCIEGLLHHALHAKHFASELNLKDVTVSKTEAVQVAWAQLVRTAASWCSYVLMHFLGEPTVCRTQQLCGDLIATAEL